MGLTYALGRQRATLLRASYSRYADGFGTSQVSANNPLGIVGKAQYQWNGNYSGGDHTITAADICLTCPFNPIGFDPNNPNAAFSPNKIDRNLKAPTTDEFMVGVEQQILPELVAGVSYTYRKHKDLIWQCPLALDNSASCIKNSDYAIFNNGETGYDANGNPWQTGPVYWVPNIPASYSFGTFETNRPDFSTIYHGVEFQMTKRLSNKWMAHASFTYNNWKEKVDNVATGCIDPTNQVASFQGYFWASGSQANGSNSCADGDIAYDYN